MSNELWSRGRMDAHTIPAPILYTRLAQTIAWCSMICADPSSKPTLRTADLAPRLLHEGRDDVVCDVGNSRERRVWKEVPQRIESMPDLRGGRLMVYFPDADLCDGAAEIESEGFFDLYNTPPWDTWVLYCTDRRPDSLSCEAYLLAYVPAPLVDLANVGIIVNPEQCIQWLSDTDVTLRARLGTV